MVRDGGKGVGGRFHRLPPRPAGLRRRLSPIDGATTATTGAATATTSRPRSGSSNRLRPVNSAIVLARVVSIRFPSFPSLFARLNNEKKKCFFSSLTVHFLNSCDNLSLRSIHFNFEFVSFLSPSPSRRLVPCPALRCPVTSFFLIILNQNRFG